MLGKALLPPASCHHALSFLVSAQAPNSAITAQTGVGVASTVHLNPMQLMTVDASHARHIQGIQPAPISTQGIQPAPIGTPGIQPAPIGTQGIHSATPISTQGLQPAPMGTQQPQPEGKTSGNFNSYFVKGGTGRGDIDCFGGLG